MAKKYYWLKLKNDFFNQKEIKKLRQIAGGDTFTIIYLKMQLLSIKNGGILEYEGTEATLAEQLSLEIDEDKDNIKITLSFLQANKLIEQINDNDFLLNKVPELIGSETDAAERMRKMRNSVTPKLQPVTKRYTEIELELDKELELETKKKAKPKVNDVRFDKFWKAYPKKVGKGAAEKSFKKSKPDNTLLEKMLTAIEIQKCTEQWTKEKGQFIPNPATWLNQKRWEDELGTGESTGEGWKTL